MSESRTAKSLKNTIVALVFYFMNLVLQFFSRKIFLDHLGTEVLGLNTTATNLLQFLNLAELGIGTAIACTLYKPLHDRNTTEINEIVSLQGWMYRRIAGMIIIGAAVLMCFFPWIFAKMLLPLWYAYASFGVLLLGALLSYFVNYKQIVLTANQQQYKIQYSYRASVLVKILCQILTIKYFNNGYVWWLILEVVFAVVASVSLNLVIRRACPYLRCDLSNGKALSRKYPDIITKIKQMFFHRIGTFTLTQTSPLIIYAYASMTLVALYGNYMLIILGVTLLLTAVFNSMTAGVGNLVAEGDQKRIMFVFAELFSARFLVICIVCFGVYALTPAFITLWIGPEYVLDNLTLGLMVAILYLNLTKATVDAFLYAYGLFSDIWAPVVEAAVNIGMSVLLGYFFGLHGILTGVLISLILIFFCWKPYFLFKKGFKEQFSIYIKLYAQHLVLVCICSVCTYVIFQQLRRYISTPLVAELCAIILFAALLFVILYFLTDGTRHATKRLLSRTR